MASLEDQLANAVQQGKIPHAVVYAATRDGTYTNLTDLTKIGVSHTNQPSDQQVNSNTNTR
ncbi:hypothetical protein BBD39_07775 [Arsenophonus endosymbiont of Bemisia tabaci Asia II 3]|nr:hypothetical protein BBD39_07775 [Arsenophonus endosymbiont of Bemisia tabaci Asia II 3]